VDTFSLWLAFRLGPFFSQSVKQLFDPAIILGSLRSDVLVSRLERLIPKLHIGLSFLKAYRRLVFGNSRHMDITILRNPEYVVTCEIITCPDEFTKFLDLRILIHVHVCTSPSNGR